MLSFSSYSLPLISHFLFFLYRSHSPLSLLFSPSHSPFSFIPPTLSPSHSPFAFFPPSLCPYSSPTLILSSLSFPILSVSKCVLLWCLFIILFYLSFLPLIIIILISQCFHILSFLIILYHHFIFSSFHILSFPIIFISLLFHFLPFLIILYHYYFILFHFLPFLIILIS